MALAFHTVHLNQISIPLKNSIILHILISVRPYFSLYKSAPPPLNLDNL
jgi:hypothetical protein